MKPGDKVICINDEFPYGVGPQGLVAGAEYTIAWHGKWNHPLTARTWVSGWWNCSAVKTQPHIATTCRFAPIGSSRLCRDSTIGCWRLSMDSQKMREALMAAFLVAIYEVGIAAFKRTSLFMSNRDASHDRIDD